MNFNETYKTYKKWIAPTILTTFVLIFLRIAAVYSNTSKYWANTYALSITMFVYQACNIIPELFETKHKNNVKLGCIAVGIVDGTVCLFVQYYDTAIYEFIGLSFCMLEWLYKFALNYFDSETETETEAEVKPETETEESKKDS